MQPQVPATSGQMSKGVLSDAALSDESAASGVSWGAILAGATAAAALSLILLSLGFGLGFSAVSPWSSSGASAAAIGIASAVWLLVAQAIASGMGGYLAGRLRTRWAAIHTDEVYFRDTAHGFLAWAAATLLTAAFLANAASSAIGAVANAGGAVAGAALTATGATAGTAAVASANRGEARDGLSYFSDMLMRGPQSAPAAGDADGGRSEAGRILISSVRSGAIDPGDRTYLAQMIAARTGISQADAEKRVDDVTARARAAAAKVETEAKQAADAARKAAAYTALWTFVALLTGAFSASLAATWGGRRRDSDAVIVRTVAQRV